MLWLAIPVLLEQVLSMLVGLSDRVLTGHYLETSHLAAINLMAYLLWLIYEMFAVVAIGGTAMVARFVGAGDQDAARRVTNQALLIGAAMALAGMVFWAAAGHWAVRLFRLDGPAAEHALTYIHCVLPVIPLIMIQAVGIACLRGAGDMVAGLTAMAIVNLVNITVSWTLVLGLGPFPALGWKGIALGTASGYAVGGMIVLRPAPQRAQRTESPAGIASPRHGPDSSPAPDRTAGRSRHALDHCLPVMVRVHRQRTGRHGVLPPTGWRSESSPWPFCRGWRFRPRPPPWLASIWAPAIPAGLLGVP